jgi:hypothetical protein
MNLDRYEAIQKKGGPVANSLRAHVEKVVKQTYRQSVLDGLLPVNQSVPETTSTIRQLVRTYIEDVLPDDVNESNISVFS